MHLFFDGWSGVGRTLLIGVLAYVAVVVFLRISGLRTLSKMNAFDFIVTVALGSTLATILLNKDVTLAEGVAALALLIAMQYAVTWTSARAAWMKRAVTGEPRLLLYQGHMLDDALKSARVTPDEVRAALRSSGVSEMADAHAVVLETDGSFTVLRDGEPDRQTSLRGVRGVPGANRASDGP
jgi:uncharacterized membrane protein YcaP (DUF421 family)